MFRTKEKLEQQKRLAEDKKRIQLRSANAFYAIREPLADDDHIEQACQEELKAIHRKMHNRPS